MRSKLEVDWWGSGEGGPGVTSNVGLKTDRAKHWVDSTGTVGVDIGWCTGASLAAACELAEEFGATISLTLSNGYLHTDGKPGMLPGDGFGADDLPSFDSRYSGYYRWFQERLALVKKVLGTRAPGLFYLDCEMKQWGLKEIGSSAISSVLYAVLQSAIRSAFGWAAPVVLYAYTGVTSSYKPKTDVVTTVSQQRYVYGTEGCLLGMSPGPICYDVGEIVGPAAYLAPGILAGERVPTFSHVLNLGNLLKIDYAYCPTQEQLTAQLAVYLSEWQPKKVYIHPGVEPQKAISDTTNDAQLDRFVAALNSVV